MVTQAPVGQTTIRPATHADLPSLVAMGRRFLRETAYRSRLVDNPVQMHVLASHLIASPEGLLLVSAAGDHLTGMIGALVFAHPLSAERIAGELMWWVEPEHRGHGLRLLKALEIWAKRLGAVKVQMIAPTPDVAALYERLGFDRIETAYQRAL